MEALRYLEFLKPDGKVIVNNLKIDSAPILAGKFDYPSGILEELQSKAETKVIDAYNIAKSLETRKS